MHCLIVLLGLAGYLFSISARAAPDHAVNTWPKLSSGNDNAICREVLAIARLAFESTAEWVFEVAPEIPVSATRIILAPTERGDGFLVDSSSVEVRQLERGT